MNKPLLGRLKGTELTPVKTRGKKRALAKQEQAQAPGIETRQHSTLKHKRRRTTGHKDELKNKEHMVARPRLSYIERLPAELLEIIFEQSCNVSFARASNYIGMRLSSQVTINKFCRRVFCEVEDGPGTVYFVGRGWLGPDVQYWRKAREQIITSRFMTDEFFIDLAEKIEAEEEERLVSITSYKDPRYKLEDSLFPVTLHLGVNFMIPLSLLRIENPKPEDIDFVISLILRGANVDIKNSTAGEDFIGLWKHCILQKDKPRAETLMEIIEFGWIDVQLSADDLFWAIMCMGEWFEERTFPWLCIDYPKTTNGQCHWNARVRAALKAKKWDCETASSRRIDLN